MNFATQTLNEQNTFLLNERQFFMQAVFSQKHMLSVTNHTVFISIRLPPTLQTDKNCKNNAKNYKNNVFHLRDVCTGKDYCFFILTQ